MARMALPTCLCCPCSTPRAGAKRGSSPVSPLLARFLLKGNDHAAGAIQHQQVQWEPQQRGIAVPAARAGPTTGLPRYQDGRWQLAARNRVSGLVQATQTSELGWPALIGHPLDRA